MPVRRIRRRYIAFLVKSDLPLSRRDIGEALIPEMMRQSNRSEMETGKVRLINYDETTCIGIIRCGHLAVGAIRSYLSKVDNIHEKRAAVQVIGISGTIRALRRKLMMSSRLD